MFFLWFRENKQFKRSNGLSGQVTPFLLVALVILLIAAIATINIGRVSLDKTCSANAADAASLAAASGYASALNNLAQMNLWQLKIPYDLNRYAYEQIYHLADDYLVKAIEAAAEASIIAAAAAVASAYPPTCKTFWTNGLLAAALDSIAAYFAFEAFLETKSFGICVNFLQSITDSFYEAQLRSYCSDVSFMDNSYESSYNAAITYAFSNSCTSSKLSDIQSDAFSAWMAAPLAENGPVKTKKYEWEDKLSTAENSRKHTVSVSLDLPRVSAYQLRHTAKGHDEIKGLLEDCSERAGIVAGALQSAQGSLITAATAIMAVFYKNVVTSALLEPSCANVYCPCCVWAVACISTLNLYSLVAPNNFAVSTILASIVAAFGAVSLYELKSKNDEAYEGWQPASGVTTIDACQNCEPCEAESPDDCQACVGAKDIMIIQIAEVVLPSWESYACVKQKHPGTSESEQGSASGGTFLGANYPEIESCSRSDFSGGSIDNFNGINTFHEGNVYSDYVPYDAHITDTK